MKKTLFDARRTLGISQSALAVATGLTQTTVSLIENGLHIPQPSTKRRLEKALNCKLRFEKHEDEYSHQ